MGHGLMACYEILTLVILVRIQVPQRSKGSVAEWSMVSALKADVAGGQSPWVRILPLPQ